MASGKLPMPFQNKIKNLKIVKLKRNRQLAEDIASVLSKLRCGAGIDELIIIRGSGYVFSWVNIEQVVCPDCQIEILIDVISNR